VGVRAVDRNGQSSPLEMADMTNGIDSRLGELPGKLEIGPNYPNPFNSSTSIKVEGFGRENVSASLEIFDILGKLVRAIKIAPESNSLTWDGTNQAGSPVVSGAYFYRLNGPEYISAAHKMILLR
jgi:hypothetical protein